MYFNAKESVKEGLLRMDAYAVEDYTHLLPIFPETNPMAAQAGSSQMDYAVQKCQKLIALHSITVSPKRKPNTSEKYKSFASQGEYNKWVDDTYLLMGQANFYLHEFHKAEENFNFILHNFSNQPTKNPAFLWLSRCYLETGEFEKAVEIFKVLERDGGLPEDIRKDLQLVKADYSLLKDNRPEAVSQLKQALTFKLSSKEKSRLNFMLAQLYRMEGQNADAIAALNKVLKASPPYRMKFESKIALLELSNSSPEEIDKALAKMVRMVNYRPYLDRIYYAKGQVELRTDRKAKAIVDFQSSVTYSLENNSQRALSSLTVARLFFDNGNYRLSSCYYDSALAVINQYYPNYEEIVAKTNGLASLVKNLDTVTREDSLQKVAFMPEKDRVIYINKLITKISEEEARRLREQQKEQNDQSYFRGQQYRQTYTNSNTSSQWYFYNSVTAGLGKTEFQRIWGKRKLEDNWRRKNKISLNPGEADQEETTAESQKKENLKPKESNPKTLEYYMQDLPLTDSLMRVSNDRIKSALFAAGRIYVSILKDEPRAIAMYEELNKRYPASLYELPTWIELHKIKYETELYRNKITGKYPESNYAKYLVNPDFFKQMEETKQLREKKYAEATILYAKGDYSSAGKLVSEVMALQPDSLLMPKIKFIELIANGKNASKEDFAKMLDKYRAEFPGSPATPVVVKIRELIQENSLAELEKMIARIDSAGMIRQQGKQSSMANDQFGGKYSYDEELFHYYVISFPTSAKVDVNRLIFDIANFNIDYYTSFDFDIEEIKLNEQIRLVVVRSLPNKEEGLGYFGNILKQSAVFKSLKGVDYHFFIASSPNYRKMVADQDLLEYLRFFVQNYSKISSPPK